MGYGEQPLVNLMNKYFEGKGIQALAYRNPQLRGREQKTDINVDSSDPDYYLAIEVKSMKGWKPLNYKSEFQTKSKKKGKVMIHQLQRLIYYADATGRMPLVFLYVRHSPRRVTKYVFDARELNQHRLEGNASLPKGEYDAWNIISEFKFLMPKKKRSNNATLKM